METQETKDELIAKLRDILMHTLPNIEYISGLAVFRRDKKQFIEDIIKALEE